MLRWLFSFLSLPSDSNLTRLQQAFKGLAPKMRQGILHHMARRPDVAYRAAKLYRALYSEGLDAKGEDFAALCEAEVLKSGWKWMKTAQNQWKTMKIYMKI